MEITLRKKANTGNAAHSIENNRRPIRVESFGREVQSDGGNAAAPPSRRKVPVMELNPYQSPRVLQPLQEQEPADANSVRQLLVEIRDGQRELCNYSAMR